MESKDELKKNDIKNRTYYYFDDIMRVIDIDFKDILLVKQSYEKILIYDISKKLSWVQNHCVFGLKK